MWALPWRVVDFVTWVVGVLDVVDMTADVEDDGAVVETLLHETVDKGDAIDVSSISPGRIEDVCY